MPTFHFLIKNHFSVNTRRSACVTLLSQGIIHFRPAVPPLPRLTRCRPSEFVKERVVGCKAALSLPFPAPLRFAQSFVLWLTLTARPQRAVALRVPTHGAPLKLCVSARVCLTLSSLMNVPRARTPASSNRALRETRRGAMAGC